MPPTASTSVILRFSNGTTRAVASKQCETWESSVKVKNRGVRVQRERGRRPLRVALVCLWRAHGSVIGLGSGDARVDPELDRPACNRRSADPAIRRHHAQPHRVLRLRRHRHHRRNLRQLDPGAVRGQAAPRAAALHRHASTRRTRWCGEINHTAEREGRRPIVFITLVNDEVLRRRRRTGCKGMVLDMFGTFVEPLEVEFGIKSNHRVGRFSDVSKSQEYNDRIEAINFSLAHDDGQSARDLEQADVILVGVSRSGKTPTSLYLAMQHGIKAANYPLIPEDFERGELPSALAPHKRKCFGLTIDPERLAQIRNERRPGQQVRGARELPLRGARGRGDDAARRHPWLSLDAQVDRGDRDDDPARHPAGAADLLSRRRRRSCRCRADSYRQIAAAAATFSDSSPPGCGMRTVQRAALAAASRRRPALRGRTPRRRAHGSAASCSACAGVRAGRHQRHAAARRARRRPRPSTRRSAKCAPMPARSTLGDHSAARALQRDHLREAEGRGAAQDAADVAGVLQAVEHHGGARRVDAAPAGPASSTKPMRRRRFERADAGEQRVATARATRRRRLRQRAQRRIGPAGSLTSACAGAPAARQRRAGTGDRLRARPCRACGRRRASLRQLAQPAPAAGCRAS